jgi:hypothetical protein
VEADGRYDERRTALAPYLDQLGVADGGLPPLHPAIMLDSWELTALEKALDQANGGRAHWHALMAESIAFQTKYFSDLEVLENEEYTSPETLETQREQWTISAAIGLALMEDIQRIIDSTISAGNMGEAKRLSGFRNKLAQTVKEIKERIGNDAFSDAESMHRDMLSPQASLKLENLAAGPQADVHPDEANEPRPFTLSEPDEGPPKQIKLNRSANVKLGHDVEVKPDHTKRLLLVLGAAALAWMILILPRMFREPLPILTLPDLPQSAAIQQVDAKPPSLYIVVNTESWRAIPREQRLKWVDEIGQAAAAAGYTGANIRTAEGSSVAQWLKQTGPRLLVNSGGGS